MKALLKNVIGARSNRKPAGRSFRPGLENLEARECLSVTIGTINSGHTLVITGDGAANAVTVTQDDDHNLLTVVAAGQTRTFNSNQITKVTVDLKGGTDTFNYKLGGGSDFQFVKDVQVQLGAGNDTATFNFADDGSGGQADIEANLSLAVNDPFGHDTVNVTLGQVQDVAVTVKTRLGFDNDTFNATLKGDLHDDANVKFDLVDVNDFVVLGIPLFRGGNDKYSVKADNDVDLDDNAVLDVNVFGASGIDTLDFAYHGELDGLLKVRLDGGDGADRITAQIHLDDDSDGTLDARVFGGKNNDTLTLNVVNDAGNDVTILSALVDGGLGIDSCVRTPNVTKISCEL